MTPIEIDRVGFFDEKGVSRNDDQKFSRANPIQHLELGVKSDWSSRFFRQMERVLIIYAIVSTIRRKIMKSFFPYFTNNRESDRMDLFL